MSGIDLRIKKLFREKKNLVISALDHVMEYGDQPGIEDARKAITNCLGTDALLLPRIMLKRHWDLFIDVNAHQNLWKIDNGIRTYELMIRIDTLLNQTKIDKIAEPFSFVDFRAIPNPNPKYAGFGLIYQKTDSGVSCDHDWD